MARTNWVKLDDKNIPREFNVLQENGTIKSVVFPFQEQLFRIGYDYCGLSIYIPAPPKTITQYRLYGEIAAGIKVDEYFVLRAEAVARRDEIGDHVSVETELTITEVETTEED